MIAMVVTLAAAGYVSFVFYQDKVERKFDKAASLCALCTTGKQVAQTNWDSVQSHLEQLKSHKRNKEAEKFAQAHASEKPDDAPCTDCDLPGPDYNTPGAVAAVGLIASVVLWGAVKPKERL
jgi:hypothetical protein